MGHQVRAWFEATEEWIVHVTSNKDSRYVGTLKYRLGQGKVTNVPGIRAEDTHDLLSREFGQRLRQDLQTMVDGGTPEALERAVYKR